MSSPTTFFRISLGLAFLVTSGLSQIVVPTSSAIAQNINSTTETTELLKLAQANAVLFVAPNGADTNSGISADQPLRSLTAALKKILKLVQSFKSLVAITPPKQVKYSRLRSPQV